MIKLGIIGAENSHSHCIGSVCNVDRAVRMRVTHIWGETSEAAEASAAKGKIPCIVEDWRKMLHEVDGVMIDHRHGADHAEAARFFIKNRVPVFVDKPMTATLSEAKGLFKLAAKHDTPIATFSLIPLQRAFRQFVSGLKKGGRIKAMNTSGPAELDSPYGGIFYYGFHQVDALVEIMGTEAHSVSLHRNEKSGVGTVFFSGDRVATINFLAEGGIFHWRVCTDKEIAVLPHQYDESIYLGSARAIHGLVAKGSVPWSQERMLAPIAILEALQRSLETGRLEKVGKVA